MKDVRLILLLATATLLSLTTADVSPRDGEPDGKLISTFQIVRFPNEACIASTSRNGTCYTSAECSDKGGTSDGSCADGFGVCCTFVITECGKTSSENITYWEAPATITSGAECQLSLNTISDNICQLRLDFTEFVITGPSTTSLSEHNFGPAGFPGGLAGMIGAAATNGGGWTTNCLTDTFSVTSPSITTKPPTICGTNTGYHMYVEMDTNMPTILSFIFASTFGPAAVAATDTKGVTALASRAWKMTAMQYDCGYINQAPIGCHQYYWADTGAQIGGLLTSYNFAGGKHLANQNQKICVRREAGTCWMAIYRTDNANDANFQVSGRTAAGPALQALTVTSAGLPCGYVCDTGTGAGLAASVCSYDCVIVPGMFVVANGADGLVDVNADAALVRLKTAQGTNHSPAGPQIGGGSVFGGAANVNALGSLSGNGATALLATATEWTVFTQHVPFTLTFKSDSFEGVGTLMEQAIVTNSVGVNLNYDLIPCTA